jgi:hypothetical protein
MSLSSVQIMRPSHRVACGQSRRRFPKGCHWGTQVGGIWSRNESLVCLPVSGDLLGPTI